MQRLRRVERGARRRPEPDAVESPVPTAEGEQSSIPPLQTMPSAFVDSEVATNTFELLRSSQLQFGNSFQNFVAPLQSILQSQQHASMFSQLAQFPQFTIPHPMQAMWRPQENVGDNRSMQQRNVEAERTRNCT